MECNAIALFICDLADSAQADGVTFVTRIAAIYKSHKRIIYAYLLSQALIKAGKYGLYAEQIASVNLAELLTRSGHY